MIIRMLLYYTLVILFLNASNLMIKSMAIDFHASLDVLDDFISLYSLCLECLNF